MRAAVVVRAAVVLLVVVVAVGVLASPASAESVLRIDDLRTATVRAGDVVAAPDGTALYATVNDRDSWTGSLVEIDPASGTVTRTAHFEHEVRPVLAVSTDGSMAYVMGNAVEDPGVFEVDLATFTVVRHAEIGNGYAILPVPGDATRYLVGRGEDGIDLIDDGVVVDTFDGGDLRQEPQVFDGTNSNRFYASGTHQYDQDLHRLYTLEVDGISLALADDTPARVTDGDWAWDDGNIVMDNGVIMNPADASTVATYPGVPSTYTTEVVIDAARDRTYFDDSGRVNEYRRSDRSLESDPRFFQNSQVERLALAGDFLFADGIYSTGYSIPLGAGPWVPSAPTGLAATSPPAGLTLTWQPPAHDGGTAITGYEVHRDGERLGTTTADVRTFVDPEAAPARWHQYRITAVNTAGSSLGSAPLEVVYAPAFDDVPASHPFYDEIRWAAENGIVGGYPDGTFRGNGHVTRQAMAAFFYRLAAFPGYQPPPQAAFPDVPADHAFYTEISWLAESGITTGYEDGLFRPGGAVTRQAMAAYLCRLLTCTNGAPPVNELPVVFPDVNRSHPFFLEITFAYFAELANGYPNGTFQPSGVITRQAATAFLYRFVDLVLSQTDAVSATDAPTWPLDPPDALRSAASETQPGPPP